LAVVVGIIYAIKTQGRISSSLVTNASWGLLYIVMFLPFIRAALSESIINVLPLKENLPAEELINK